MAVATPFVAGQAGVTVWAGLGWAGPGPECASFALLCLGTDWVGVEWAGVEETQRQRSKQAKCRKSQVQPQGRAEQSTQQAAWAGRRSMAMQTRRDPMGGAGGHGMGGPGRRITLL
ncbi:hypothetical protein LX36DRAFT_658779 [Colletotrichum falcatum]|nr:hypothetical protein LX36DRAFT_658779 [Colletotrichum falcatum]